jgi:spermidine synthase
VAGALAAGFWLIPRGGIGVLLGGLALSLAALALAWLVSAKAGPRAAAALIAALAAAGLARPRPRPIPGLRAAETSLYGDVLVVDREDWGKRVLYIDGIANTVVDLHTLQSTSDYIRSFELARFLRPRAAKALLVGLGGGALPGRLARFGVSTDVVDIDPAVERAARRWFGFRPTGELHIEDGRRFLSRPGPAYDFIYFDAFNGDQQPFHLFTRESFEETARRLSPDGVLVINLIGYAMGPRAELKRSVTKTLRSVFPNVRLLAANTDLNPAQSYVNMTFLASRGPLDFQADPEKDPEIGRYASRVRANWIEEGAGDGELLTDDRAPVEALGADAFVAIRQRDLGSNLELLTL